MVKVSGEALDKLYQQVQLLRAWVDLAGVQAIEIGESDATGELRPDGVLAMRRIAEHARKLSIMAFNMSGEEADKGSVEP